MKSYVKSYVECLIESYVECLIESYVECLIESYVNRWVDRKQCLKHCLTHVMHSIDPYFEAVTSVSKLNLTLINSQSTLANWLHND